MAPLRCAAKLDPFFSLDCARVEGEGRNPRDQILLSADTVSVKSAKLCQFENQSVNYLVVISGDGGREESHRGGDYMTQAPHPVVYNVR